MPARMPSLARLVPPTGAPDADLLARFANQHDEAAFAELVARHGPLVLGVCRRVVADRHLAEDCFQAVFLALARQAAGVKVGPSLANWLFGTARRVALAARRREARHANRVSAVAGDPPPDAPPDWDDLLKVLDDELARLPTRYRAPLVECFLRERTQDEAAATLGWSLSTVRRRLARGKELLRARLTGRGATLAGGLLAGVVAPSACAAVPRALLADTARAACGLAEPTAAVSALAGAGAVGGGLALKVTTPIATLILGGLVAGFATTAEPPAPPPLPTASVAAVTPVPPKPAPAPVPGEWVTVRGRVVLPDAVPLPDPQLVPRGSIKDAQHFPPLLATGEVAVNPDDRGVKNVVVWLRPDTDDRKAPFPAAKVHPGRRALKPAEHVVEPLAGHFHPRVVAARTGDSLVLRNNGPVAVNARADIVPANPAAPGMPFNYLLPRGGERRVPTAIPATRTGQQLRCDIYPWMTGWVWGFDHPYFAVTDEHGRFEIADAPAGTWRLAAWHEAVGFRGRSAVGERVAVRDAGSGKQSLAPVGFDVTAK